ncbi:MAG: TrkH family potassium uptake protein [Bifidobacteriaceae bacterium]|jgi:Trk-type K+ transport system membrane component|nr:TrkH family potassium uptake protein [Bifidobacteriaceae bacterium]
MRADSAKQPAPARSLPERLSHLSPARLTVFAFTMVVLLAAVTLTLPIATRSGRPASFVDALFTATSATCVTGLTSVDTAEYWSLFGQITIVGAMQIGGLGVMTLGSLLSLITSNRLGLRTKLLTRRELGVSRLGEVALLVRAVAVISLIAELALAAVLIPRFLAVGEAPQQAVWHGIFYAVSTFNNAGFVPTQEGLVPYAGDWLVLGPIMTGVFVGSLGFPVILDIARNVRHPSTWTLHTKLTCTFCLALLGVSVVLFSAAEWSNPDTLGSFSSGDTLLNTIFAGVMTRSGGFATFPVNQEHPATLLAQDALMFVGGGSASTAGGIKVTTLAVLLLAILAEARGDRDMEAFGRRMAPGVLRVAVTVTMASVMLVFTGAMVLTLASRADLHSVLFECISAFATCGLSTGLSATLPAAGKITLVLLMLAGRLGTMTLAASVALTNRRRLIRLPEDRPIVG